jgi:hypothetical protein
MLKTVSKPLAHLNFLSGVNCYDIGSMVKIGTSHFRFAHDKVREAAFSLIPNEEKNQVSKAW